MSRKRGFRASICFTLVLMLLFSFSGVSALAAETKYVTVTVPQSVTCPDTVFGDVLQSISQSTYAYDDGAYKGTLSFNGFSIVSATPVYPYPGANGIYNYTFSVTYAGTVTSYVTATKTVSVTTSTYSITAPLEAAGSIQQSIYGGSMYYDDGSYHGLIPVASINNWTATLYDGSKTPAIYQFTFTITFAGTVTKY